MANLKKISFVSLGLIVLFSTGCNPIKKMTKNIDKINVHIIDEILEVHADSVAINFDAEFPKRYFKPKAIMKLEPIVVYKQDSVFLPPMILGGEKVNLAANSIKAKNKIPYKTASKVEFRDKARYEVGMRDAKVFIVTSLKIDSRFDELDNCECENISKVLSEGVITTSQTVKNNEDKLLGGSYAAEKMTAKGSVYYQKSQADLKKGQTESKDFKIPFVLEPVKEIALKSGMEFESISTISQASPDGSIDHNEKLALKRKEASFKYITNYLKKEGFEAIYDSAFYKPKTYSEDWEGLKRLVSSSDLSTKADVNKIIGSNLQLDEKEDNIRKLVGNDWNYLASEILPKLRKTEILFTAKTRIRDLAILQQLYKADSLDQLYNKQELLLLAFNETDLDKQMELFELYKKNYPDELTGDNNIAAVYLMKGEPEMALEILEPLSGKYPNTKEIVNNIAIANRMMGKYDTALELYDQANSLGAPQKNNKGILFIKTADYDLSINTFESDRYDYNRALAYTLKQDFNGAKDVLEKIEDKSADDFYLRAIVGARTKDVELMSTSLTRAIKLDSSIRERAKGDYEFRHYWDKTEFQNAIR
jgi:hypothetical protein